MAYFNDGRRLCSLPRGFHQFGRDRRICSLILEDDLVSRVHGWIVGVGDEWRILDASSSNGIRVNLQEVSQARLEKGDTIGVGNHNLVFDPSTEGPEPLPEPPRSVSNLLAAESGALVTLRERVGHTDAGRLGLLHSVCRMLVGDDRPAEAQVARLIRDGLGADRVRVFRLQDDSLRHSLTVEEEVELDGAPAVSRLLATTCSDPPETLLSRNVSNDPRFGGRGGAGGVDIGSALATPLVDRRDVVGALVVENRTGSDWFHEADRLFLERLAPFAARALRCFI